MGVTVLGIDVGPSECGWMVLATDRQPGTAHHVASGKCAARGAVITDLLATHAPTVVSVERPRWHTRSDASAVAMRAIADQLLQTQYVAARIVGLARGAGLRVFELPAQVWRKGLLGNGQSSDAAIKAALSVLLRLPKRTNNHERDAGGVALAAVRLLGTRGEGPYGRSAFDDEPDRDAARPRDRLRVLQR